MDISPLHFSPLHSLANRCSTIQQQPPSSSSSYGSHLDFLPLDDEDDDRPPSPNLVPLDQPVRHGIVKVHTPSVCESKESYFEIPSPSSVAEIQPQAPPSPHRSFTSATSSPTSPLKTPFFPATNFGPRLRKFDRIPPWETEPAPKQTRQPSQTSPNRTPRAPPGFPLNHPSGSPTSPSGPFSPGKKEKGRTGMGGLWRGFGERIRGKKGELEQLSNPEGQLVEEEDDGMTAGDFLKGTRVAWAPKPDKTPKPSFEMLPSSTPHPFHPGPPIASRSPLPSPSHSRPGSLSLPSPSRRSYQAIHSPSGSLGPPLSPTSPDGACRGVPIGSLQGSFKLIPLEEALERKRAVGKVPSRESLRDDKPRGPFRRFFPSSGKDKDDELPAENDEEEEDNDNDKGDREEKKVFEPRMLKGRRGSVQDEEEDATARVLPAPREIASVVEEQGERDGWDVVRREREEREREREGWRRKSLEYRSTIQTLQRQLEDMKGRISRTDSDLLTPDGSSKEFGKDL